MLSQLDALTLVTPIWARAVGIALVLLGITYIGLRIAFCVAQISD